MFRIYRDARFSKNKSPYKEHAAVQLRHHLGKDAHAPAFYVHIEKGNIIFGGGIWTPQSDILLKIRTRIVEMPKLMWQQLSGQFFKRHSEFAQTPPVTYNY